MSSQVIHRMFGRSAAVRIAADEQSTATMGITNRTGKRISLCNMIVGVVSFWICRWIRHPATDQTHAKPIPDLYES
jgi:hypothetical protein